MKTKLPLLFDLFLCFFKIGAFTFGGGYAMISIVHHSCVEEKKWITDEEMVNLTVIAESTPGPIAINCATYTGYKVAGLPGALCATLGMILPSLVIIYLISLYLDNFLEISLIAKAFAGIKIGVGVLIFNTGLTMAKKLPKKAQPRIMLVFFFTAMLLIDLFALNISSITLMLFAALISLGLFALKGGAAK